MEHTAKKLKPTEQSSSDAPKDKKASVEQNQTASEGWSELAMGDSYLASEKIQAKLSIGSVDDPLEREADMVAEQVVRSPINTSYEPEKIHSTQKKTALGSSIQRVSTSCSDADDLVQNSFIQRKSDTGSSIGLNSNVQNLISSPGAGKPLSDPVRNRIEPVLGTDLSGVRVHSDQRAQQAAGDIQAKAFTNKNNIYLGRNQSSEDVSLMAHEATHTVQQTGNLPKLQPKPISEKQNGSSFRKYDHVNSGGFYTPDIQCDLTDISLPSVSDVVEVASNVDEALESAGQSLYAAGESAVESITNLSLDDLLELLESGGELVYRQVLETANDIGLLSDLLSGAAASLRTRLFDYLRTEWLIPLLDSGDELAIQILKHYWPDNSGWVGNVRAEADTGIDLSDIGFPVKLLLEGGIELELSLMRLGSVVTAQIQAKESAAIGLSGTIKALEVQGRLPVKAVDKFQSATDLKRIEWSTHIVSSLRRRDVRGFFKSIWSQAQSFWDATQFEYTHGASIGLGIGAEAGLDSLAVGKVKAGVALGFRSTFANPTPYVAGKLKLQGEVELNASVSGELGGIIPELGNLLNILGTVVGAVGMRIEWRIPPTNETGGISLHKVSLYEKASLQVSNATFTTQGMVGVEGEMVFWNNGALLPDVAGMFERLSSGEALTQHDIESMIPFQELNFEISGMGRYTHLVNFQDIFGGLVDLVGGFSQGSMKLRFNMPRYRVIAMIRRQPESLMEVIQLLLSADFVGALRKWVDTASENMADIVSSVVNLTVEVRSGPEMRGRWKTPGHGDITGVGAWATASLAEVQRYVFDADELHANQLEQMLRDIIHTSPGSGPQLLEPTPEQDAAAERAKALRQERDEETDPARQRELDQLIEETLNGVRPDLEAMVRNEHPSLTAVDPDKNLYKVTIDGHEYYGTIEALLDFQGPTSSVRALGELIFTRDMISDDSSLSVTGGLAGTSSQGRASPFPGDVDLGETIRIDATSATAASQLLAQSIQQTVARATEPRADGRPKMVFLSANFGRYPEGHPARGRIAWLRNDIDRGYISWIENTYERRYTMAEALASPGATGAVNTFWRGPIDSRGTFGEVTKVMTYEAFNRDTGEQLFATPEVGQAFQTVSFGRPQIHDIERNRLLSGLMPQIGKYFREGNYIKAVKRAYTVARILNDIHAVNDLAPLMAGPQAKLRQLIDHLGEFSEGIAKPSGIGVGLTSPQEAKALAEDLVVRTRGIDVAQGEALGVGLGAAGPDVREDVVFYNICNTVLKALRLRADGNTEYATQVGLVLFTHDYLDDPEPRPATP